MDRKFKSTNGQVCSSLVFQEISVTADSRINFSPGICSIRGVDLITAILSPFFCLFHNFKT